MTSDQPTYAEFAQQLIETIGFPILAKGYGELIKELKQNQALGKLMQSQDITALLSGDHPEMAGLKKNNKELVTAFEKQAEHAMRHAVRVHFPHHAILGEEHGYQKGNEIRWIFDPVDGTSAMIKNALAEAFGIALPHPIPAFGTTIGVVEGNEAIMGFVARLTPHKGTLALSDCWIGEKGCPTRCNSLLITLPAATATLAEARLACTMPQIMFNTPDKWSGFQSLADACKNCITEQNCIGAMHLLSASADIFFEADLAYHDAAALIPILEGAGITVSSDSGGKLSFAEKTIGHEFRLLAAQPALHILALAKIRIGVPEEQNRFLQNATLNQGYAQKFT